MLQMEMRHISEYPSKGSVLMTNRNNAAKWKEDGLWWREAYKTTAVIIKELWMAHRIA